MLAEGSEIHGRSLAGDLAADVFALLDLGTSPVDVVIELSVPPARFEVLWRTWARLRGHVLMPLPSLEALATATSTETKNLDSAAAIVGVLQRFDEQGSLLCERCQTGWAQYCSGCPREAAREASEAEARARKGRRRRKSAG